MSDNLGTLQTRVLDPDDRNFEEVIYQKRKPPLSSEVNLDGRNYAYRDGRNFRTIMPSGWAITGDIKEGASENSCYSGDVLTSPSLDANVFRLIALDKGVENRKLIAWVNGWRIVVQGNTPTTPIPQVYTNENNTIQLSAPASSNTRVDFVFLEVWRKLITPSDTTIYKFGNREYGGTSFSNDLVDPAINIETSLRIQIQYRIRSAPTDIITYPDGFDPAQVYAQGPLSAPLTCSTAVFTSVAGDPGLWRAGLGDSASQSALGTVDGYIYAIPMFAITRRNTSAYDPDNNANGAGRSKSDYDMGKASDRPDNKYSNIIVASDILDLRHRVSPQENYKEICEDAFKRLTRGDLRTKMGFTTLGGNRHGPVLVQADAISNVDKDGSVKLPGNPDGARRVYSNAAYMQPETFSQKTVSDKTGGGTPGANWASGDRVHINLSAYPSGTVITSLDEAYIQQGALLDTTAFTDLTTVSSIPTSNLILEVPGTSALVGDSSSFVVEYTVSYPSGPYGLSAVPNQVLEMRREDSTVSIAAQDADIRSRLMDSTIVSGDSTYMAMLHNAGGYGTAAWNFGHQMIYYTSGGSLSFARTLGGHEIIGIARARINDATEATISAVTRTSTNYSPTLSPSPGANDIVEFTLYTASKFFQTNKQGRAILDCFEMEEMTPIEAPGGGRTIFHLDTTDQAILAIASDYVRNGNVYAWADSALTTITNITNSQLPQDSTKTYVEIEFGAAPGTSVEVPVLRRSAVRASEGYTFFYEKTPYQGWLDGSNTPATGKIEAVGPAITTTAGSGAIGDYTYSTGSVSISADSTALSGSGTEWLNSVKAGYYFSADGTNQYRINSVYNNTSIFLESSYDGTSVVSGAYTITALDVPFIGQRNIIDRLQTADSDSDASGKNGVISTAVSDAFPTLETRIVSRVQDIMDMSANSAQIGLVAASDGRGYMEVYLDSSLLGRGNLGLKFEKLDTATSYQKTYQSYALNKDSGGQLYMMVVGSEENYSSASRALEFSSAREAVDIFELPGRPLTQRRTK